MPSTVTTIKENAFYGAGKLTSVTVPASVTSIGDFSFEECYNLTLKVAEDSYALQYAKIHDIKYLIDSAPTVTPAPTSIPTTDIPADANGDGVVDDLDLVRLLKYLCGWDVQINFLNADVNGDGVVDDLDTVRLLKYLCG